MTIEIFSNKINLPIAISSYGKSTIDFYFEEVDAAKIRSAFRNLFENKQSAIVPLQNSTLLQIDCNRGGSEFSVKISVHGNTMYFENLSYNDFEIFK